MTHCAKPANFSEKNVIDCIENGNYDCSKGISIDRVFKYAKNTGLRQSKFYNSINGPKGAGCQKNQINDKDTLFRIRDYKEIDIHMGHEKVEKELEEIVGKCGPVSVDIDYQCTNFDDPEKKNTACEYSDKKGILEYKSICPEKGKWGPGSESRHAVSVVGYGVSNNEKFWIIKNSYGQGWGDNGFIKIKRGVNFCNIAKYNLRYPIIKNPEDCMLSDI